MVKCEICGKEYKTAQGLRGHLTFHHGITGGKMKPSKKLATEEDIRQLTERQTATEKRLDEFTERYRFVADSSLHFLDMVVTELLRNQKDNRQLLMDILDTMDKPSAGDIRELKDRCRQGIDATDELMDEVMQTSQLLRKIIALPVSVIISDWSKLDPKSKIT